MGTSKVYESPKWPGVNRAVGDAASSENPTIQEVSAAVGAFAGAYKTYLKSGTRTSGSSGSVTGTGQRSSGGGTRGGGSGGAARARSAASGASLAHFISIAGKSGLDTALREFNLADLRDKPLDEFLELVAERLSVDGGLLDDNALNLAMAETINELAKTVDSVEALDILLSSGNINIEEVLQVYFANILAANFEQKEYSVVREKVSRENTNDFFAHAREIIRSIVRDELSAERDLATIDWNSADGQLIADAINRDVLDILIP
ncbi:hypothetical protein [Geobacter sp. SVR]|uniref:hypothetical protein n=1 Tax=Geobacter sp. SVR TaxID=2495594 RepID=UPI00143F02F7|nr:hypothetical protein [Geobacter sp. SVR]BCS51815.1 hypothetical protein GSVR_01230 [Geobacter sp. SVR]GCF86998.1 hypothetical protein GSbR_35980 [Geobacter sp. SVR]